MGGGMGNWAERRWTVDVSDAWTSKKRVNFIFVFFLKSFIEILQDIFYL